jgi:hypothetical protein
MKDLIKKYPNDLELGRAVRKQFLMDGDEAAELLKEVLALHGFGGYGYSNGLVERGKIYLESEREDGNIRKWKNSCDGEMMNEVDEKIKTFLQKIGDDDRKDRK